MFLTKLVINPRSSLFRLDSTNVHNMHRTVMSAYPDQPDATTYRQSHGVLWRLDPANNTYIQYVQSRTRPDWTTLPTGHLLHPPQIRPLEPLLDAITPGRKLAFRLQANPTRCIANPRNPRNGQRVPHRLPTKQIEWLIGKAEQHGFAIPTDRRGQPDVTPSRIPALTGRKATHKITIEPVRYDGHLIVTDPQAFTEAVTNGVGPAKSYGCGLLSLAPARTT